MPEEAKINRSPAGISQIVVARKREHFILWIVTLVFVGDRAMNLELNMN